MARVKWITQKADPPTQTTAGGKGPRGSRKAGRTREKQQKAPRSAGKKRLTEEKKKSTGVAGKKYRSEVTSKEKSVC